jgi:hypothetical protein
VSGSTGTESAAHTHLLAADLTAGGSALSASNYMLKASSSYELRGTNTVASIGLSSTQSTNHTHAFSTTTSAGTSHTHSISPFGGTETRPVNISANWIIKL